MGKRLIIKGADFSVNGMKSVNYKNALYCTSITTNPTFYLVGSGKPLETISSDYVIEIEADVENKASQFNVFRAWFFTTGNAYRLSVNKPNTTASGVSPFVMKSQVLDGEYNIEHASVANGHKSIIFKNGDVYIDGVKGNKTPKYPKGAETLTFAALYGINSAGNDVSVKYNRITFKTADGATTLANYVPALDDSGIVALYDSVSENFIYPEEGTDWVAE